ncbi:Rrf2 family transcriptional regulator [Aminobacter niigataensis]|uniref:Rrf2 family transcriptional regulator n=1 Tax=Aminobacter niigataensis TaxID=83265 RepID=UPI00298F1EF4|nr:Rrf2 family transcriptional regulator [Aminobacter niigataensis]
MTQDSRLSRMLHMLIHIDLHDGRATSETIAQMLGTNPVVVRRMMAGLRKQGYVEAARGPNGGWKLARRLEDITVLDVHRALGSPSLFAVGLAVDHPDCPVERSVNAALGTILDDAETRVMSSYRSISLADLIPAIKR